MGGCDDGEIDFFIPLNQPDPRFEMIQKVYFHRFLAVEQYNGLLDYIQDFLYLQYDIQHNRTMYDQFVVQHLGNLGFKTLPTLGHKKTINGVVFVKFTEYFDEYYTVEMVYADDEEYIVSSPVAEDINIPFIFREIGRDANKNKIKFEYGYNQLMDE